MAFPVFSANLALGAVENGFIITELIDAANAIYAAEPYNAPPGVPGFVEVADDAALAALPTATLVPGDKALVAATGEVYSWNGTAWRDLSPNESFVDVADEAARLALDTTNYAVGDMVRQTAPVGEVFVWDGANLVTAAGFDRHTGHGPTLPQGAAYTTYMASNLRGFDKTDDADGTPIGHYVTDEAGTSGNWIRT